MLTLPNLLVSPRFANIKIVATELVGDYLFGKVDDERFKKFKTDQAEVMYNIKTGVITSVDEDIRSQSGRRLSFEDWARRTKIDMIKYAEGAVLSSNYRMRVDEAYQRYSESCASVEMRKPNHLRVLTALANHQVGGDELIKGLKAEGLDVEFKITNNYLGGWSFGYEVTIEDFILAL